jgi:hypothetical protein
MSLELIDLRAKITAETYCAIAAHARAHDVEKGEVVREILHGWAVKQIHGARMLASCLRAKGMTAAAEGIGGAATKADGLTWGEE